MIFHLYKHFLLQVQLRSICAGVGRGVGDRQGEYIVIVFVTCIRKCLCNVEKSGKFLSGFLNLDHHSIPPFPLLASAPPASASPCLLSSPGPPPFHPKILMLLYSSRLFFLSHLVLLILRKKILYQVLDLIFKQKKTKKHKSRECMNQANFNERHLFCVSIRK